jgi:hypothetical protein
MISHHFPLDKFGEALNTFVTRADNALKVIVEP